MVRQTLSKKDLEIYYDSDSNRFTRIIIGGTSKDLEIPDLLDLIINAEGMTVKDYKVALTDIKEFAIAKLA